MPAPRTLITGATGFVGGHLIDRLDGTRTICGWHRPGGRPPDRTRAVEWQPVDVLDGKAVARALADWPPDEIYHLAGSPHVGASWSMAAAQLETNVLGTHHLLEAVRRASVPCRIVMVSSAQIYKPGDEPIDEQARKLPSSPYGVSKLAADDLALRAAAEDGVPVIVARPFNHAGPHQSPEFVVSSFARQIALIEAGRAAPEIKVGNLEARRDLTDVRDVVRAYLLLMDAGRIGEAYNICSGRAWRIGDLLDELLQIVRLPVRIETDASRLRPQDSTVLQGDASRIRSELGWTPVIRVEQTLRDTLDWWRAEIRDGR
jgi:GDP-4-dehydro-6-deoxy-D-mannose reductase